MTQEDIEELICQAEECLKNDPERARQGAAEIETIKLEYPDFFKRTAGRTVGQLTRSELKEMIRIVEAHEAKNRSAN